MFIATNWDVAPISPAALGPAYAERLVDALLPMLQPAPPPGTTNG